MKNIVSYSLWGNNKMYWNGALYNIELVKKYYPDFICRFYIDKCCDQKLIDSIEESDKVEKVIINNKPDVFYGMFWRFFAADDKDVDIMLSRDCDSRISEREVAAVREWLSSDKDFHIMRDHPLHGIPILAGMWGCRNGILRDIGLSSKIDQWNQFDKYGVDQDFLRDIVYPLIKSQSMEHDEFFNFNSCKKKFPIGRIDMGFVGEIYDENNVRNPNQYKIIPV